MTAPRTTRALAAEQTRARLIASGLALAERLGLESLSVNAIVADAGVSKGTFFHHFSDRTSYLIALHRDFHDALGERIRAETVGLPPGRERLRRAAHSYLDGCLEHRGVKALLLEARGHRPIVDEVLARNRRNVEAVAADFAALGRSHPRHSARLWVAATAECALAELELGHPDEAIRDALDAFSG